MQVYHKIGEKTTGFGGIGGFSGIFGWSALVGYGSALVGTSGDS